LYTRLFVVSQSDEFYLIAEAVLVETVHVGSEGVLAVTLSFSLKTTTKFNEN
jgi:hypothetical protein